jgi:branched-chain amino acid transport system ATP-binding protein
MSFLEIRRLTKFFGGLAAVHSVDIKVDRGQIFGLIGPNGAGKSTVLNMIDGTLRPSYGEITFNGEEVTRLPAHEHARRGIGRVFQENALFSGLTVLQNVRVGYHLSSKMDPIGLFVNTLSHRKHEDLLQEKALETLRFVGLSDQFNEQAINLPHGRQRLLCLAIALATGPKLLLLDEPLTGMNAEEIKEMLRRIRAIKDERGVTCIIIEHNLRAVMGLCDWLAVLNFGEKIAEGPPGEVVKNPAVVEAYLGTEDDVA